VRSAGGRSGGRGRLKASVPIVVAITLLLGLSVIGSSVSTVAVFALGSAVGFVAGYLVLKLVPRGWLAVGIVLLLAFLIVALFATTSLSSSPEPWTFLPRGTTTGFALALVAKYVGRGGSK
jgi:uncharacterized membrane protein YfcA